MGIGVEERGELGQREAFEAGSRVVEEERGFSKYLFQ
jgi:hypothetical protein